MSDQKTITIKNWNTIPFEVDPNVDNEAQTIDLQIRRFTVEEGKTFNANWKRIMDPPSGRQLYRLSRGDEQERVTRTRNGLSVDTFLVPDDEIRRRRIQEMDNNTTRDAYLLLEAEDHAFEYDYLVTIVSQYIRVAPGQRVVFDLDDGSEPVVVRTGADLVKVFGGQRPQLIRLGSAIWAENNLGSNEKKAWRSLSGSKPSSSVPTKAANGLTPAGTVTPAENEASAATADAMALSAPILSGSTET